MNYQSKKIKVSMSPNGVNETFFNIYMQLHTFQSSHPCRKRLEIHVHARRNQSISIHTPLAGSDCRNETFLTK